MSKLESNVYILSMHSTFMTQYRVSEEVEKRMKAWLAKKTDGVRTLRDTRGHTSWNQLTFDQALDELLRDVGF